MDYSRGDFVENHVCSSLRHRPTWASTATQLLQSDGRRWRETNFVTHDIALIIPGTHTDSYDIFRLLLLSPSDIDNPQTLPRIQQLHQLSNGRNVALLFLLYHQHGTQAAMQPFMNLHIQLTTHACPTPIIPLTCSPSTTPGMTEPDAVALAAAAALQSLQSTLTTAASQTAHCGWRVDAAQDLLPYCSVGAAANVTTGDGNSNIMGNVGSSRGPSAGFTTGNIHNTDRHSNHNPTALFSNRTAEALMNMGLFSFRDLIQAMGTEEGQEVVREVAGEGMVAFWGNEFATSGSTG